MGDNHHVYRRISESLRQIYPKRLTGNQARHMNTLAGMVSGIVRSGKSQLKAMAKKAPTTIVDAHNLQERAWERPWLGRETKVSSSMA